MSIQDTATCLFLIATLDAIGAMTCPASAADNISAGNVEIEKADIVLSVAGPNSIDIGIGRITNGKRYPKLFPKELLQTFLKRERQKQLLLVCSQRPDLINDELRDFLQSLGFKKLVECRLKADDVYATRRKLPRNDNKHDQWANYYGLREIDCVGSPDALTMNIGIEIPSLLHSDLTEIGNEQIFSREELLPFLQQDVQRHFLVIMLEKNAHTLEPGLKPFVQKSHFPLHKFEKATGMFQVEPKVISP